MGQPSQPERLRRIQASSASLRGGVWALGTPHPRHNEPDRARQFAEDLRGRIVYKPFAYPALAEAGTVVALFTTDVSPEDYGHPGISLTAHLFQERVDKEHEVRLTVVGDRFFAAEIHPLSDAAARDWRADYANHHYEVTDVSDDVRSGLRR